MFSLFQVSKVRSHLIGMSISLSSDDLNDSLSPTLKLIRQVICQNLKKTLSNIYRVLCENVGLEIALVLHSFRGDNRHRKSRKNRSLEPEKCCTRSALLIRFLGLLSNLLNLKYRSDPVCLNT